MGDWTAETMGPQDGWVLGHYARGHASLSKELSRLWKELWLFHKMEGALQEIMYLAKMGDHYKPQYQSGSLEEGWQQFWVHLPLIQALRSLVWD